MTPPDPPVIAERLRLARRMVGMSQEEAANALEPRVSVRTYARWENGETLGFLGRIDELARLFQTTPATLKGFGATPENGAVANPAVEEQVAKLADELHQLRQLLLDPQRLREAADALIESERDDEDDS